jgi:NADPH2:quinone reductase
MMRAVVVKEFGVPDDLSIEELPNPVPKAGEVAIDIEAVAVNFVDLLVISGKYQFLPPRPFTPGKLPAGIVTAVGPDVANFAVGDRVQTLLESGGYAQKAVAPASACFQIPANMSFTDAAAIALAFDTAWFALKERARLGKGETVLVLGASGGVGVAAMQLAKAFGARVIAGISSPAKEAFVRQNGADEVIDLGRDNIKDSLREQVWALTDKRGVDVVVDSLGDRFFEASLRALPTVKANYLLVKNIEVSGLQVSDYRKRKPQRMAECFQEIFALYERGAIKAPPAITEPLDNFAKAMNDLAARRASARIVLCPNLKK